MIKYREGHDKNCNWLSHKPTFEEPYFGECSCGYNDWEVEAEDLVIRNGCICHGGPLLGWIPNVGPRCRLCNTTVNLKENDIL